MTTSSSLSDWEVLAWPSVGCLCLTNQVLSSMNLVQRLRIRYRVIPPQTAIPVSSEFDRDANRRMWNDAIELQRLCIANICLTGCLTWCSTALILSFDGSYRIKKWTQRVFSLLTLTQLYLTHQSINQLAQRIKTRHREHSKLDIDNSDDERKAKRTAINMDLDVNVTMDTETRESRIYGVQSVMLAATGALCLYLLIKNTLSNVNSVKISS